MWLAEVVHKYKMVHTLTCIGSKIWSNVESAEGVGISTRVHAKQTDEQTKTDDLNAKLKMVYRLRNTTN